MGLKDGRIKLMNQILSGIKVSDVARVRHIFMISGERVDLPSQLSPK